MANFIHDGTSKRWVVATPHRASRPHTTKDRDDVCPFCPGNERETPPEVYRMGPGEKDKKGWLVRVVPNKYAITDIHEVIIHSPDETKDIEDLPLEQVNRIFLTYRDRFRAHEKDGHVVIFCNHGHDAGASLAHPHSQLVVVPASVTIDSPYRQPISNIVDDNIYYTTYCPAYSAWPYEVWIAPNNDDMRFGDINERQVVGLAGVVQQALKQLQAVLAKAHRGRPFSYNFYIYHGASWYVRIIPRVMRRAGFELGTGIQVNSVDPAVVAQQLKKILQ